MASIHELGHRPRARPRPSHGTRPNATRPGPRLPTMTHRCRCACHQPKRTRQPGRVRTAARSRREEHADVGAAAGGAHRLAAPPDQQRPRAAQSRRRWRCWRLRGRADEVTTVPGCDGVLTESDAHEVPCPHSETSRAARVSLTMRRIAPRRLSRLMNSRRTRRSAASHMMPNCASGRISAEAAVMSHPAVLSPAAWRNASHAAVSASATSAALTTAIMLTLT